MPPRKKAPTKRAAPPKSKAPAKAPAPSHRQRFEQLLDDAVLGVPPKR